MKIIKRHRVYKLLRENNLHLKERLSKRHRELISVRRYLDFYETKERSDNEARFEMLKEEETYKEKYINLLASFENLKIK